MERFLKVDEGLLRGSAPSEEEVVQLHDDFGVKRIISLDKQESDRISRICEELGIDHIDASIEGKNLDDSLKYLDDNVVDLLTTNPVVFVHCLHGKDRTGLAIALYRIRVQRWTPTDALREAMQYGFGVGVSPSIRHKYCKMILDSSPVVLEEDLDINPTSDSRKRKRKLRKVVLEDMNDAMPQVGLYDGVSTTLRSTVSLPAIGYTSVFPYGGGYVL